MSAWKIFGSLCILLLGTPVAAANLQITPGGRLLGATGVIFGNSVYSVEFIDGSCNSLFGDCLDNSQFAFKTEASATEAMQALFDQVIINTAIEPFRDKPGQTNGCSTVICDIVVPYAVDLLTMEVLTVVGRNYPVFWQPQVPDYEIFAAKYYIENNTISEPGTTFASFSPIPPVPLPAGGWMLLAALAATAAFRRGA